MREYNRLMRNAGLLVEASNPYDTKVGDPDIIVYRPGEDTHDPWVPPGGTWPPGFPPNIPLENILAQLYAIFQQLGQPPATKGKLKRESFDVLKNAGLLEEELDIEDLLASLVGGEDEEEIDLDMGDDEEFDLAKAIKDLKAMETGGEDDEKPEKGKGMPDPGKMMGGMPMGGMPMGGGAPQEDAPFKPPTFAQGGMMDMQPPVGGPEEEHPGQSVEDAIAQAQKMNLPNHNTIDNFHNLSSTWVLDVGEKDDTYPAMGY